MTHHPSLSLAYKPHPIHPFPARMASEVALRVCENLPRGAVVLDPMAGSGTVLRVAAEQGHHALGFDLDPLAVLMARVWTTKLDPVVLIQEGAALVDVAKTLSARDSRLSWIDNHPETRAFVQSWFGKQQRGELKRLSSLLYKREGPVADALRVAFSRLIITKDKGASLAADVSHSRPHRVLADGQNDFPVYLMFERAVRMVAQRLASERLRATVEVREGDARQLDGVSDGSISAVITSPPYLNAIDYLRGHRMALVWLGYRIDALRVVRSNSIGAERAPQPEADAEIAASLTAGIDPDGKLDRRRRRMVDRFALDMDGMLAQAHRVLEPGGTAVLVVGNSTHRGVYVENTAVVQAAGLRHGFLLVSTEARAIPESKRYLPPPSDRETSMMGRRMRTETVLTLAKAA